MNNRILNNQVQITGELITNFALDHEVYGEGFYKAVMKVLRSSDATDEIPIMVSERLMDVKADWKGYVLKISGQLRSFNLHTETGHRLVLSVFAREAEFADPESMSDQNSIILDGYLCKKPHYRTTPLEREITDMMIAVNRPYGKSDYLPCICWGRNARYAAGLDIGSHIVLEGRIQSRDYAKTMEDGTVEIRTAYEVSVSAIQLIED